MYAYDGSLGTPTATRDRTDLDLLSGKRAVHERNALTGANQAGPSVYQTLHAHTLTAGKTLILGPRRRVVFVVTAVPRRRRSVDPRFRCILPSFHGK